MGQAVKGHLLDVEVPVKEEAAPVHHNKGDEHQKGEAKPQEKGFQKVVVPKAPFFFFERFHKSAYLRTGFRQGGAPACL